MKKNRLFFMFAALFVATAVMFSCQKEEVVSFEDGLMLKNALIDLPACDAGCITTIQQYGNNLIKGSTTVVGNFQVHNTKTHLIVRVNLNESLDEVVVEINSTLYKYWKDADEPQWSNYVTTSTPDGQKKITWMQVSLPLAANVSCTAFTIKIDVAKGGKAEVLYKQYEWCEDGCDVKFTLEDVSACGVEARYAEFLYVAGDDGEVKIQGGLTKGATGVNATVTVNGNAAGSLQLKDLDKPDSHVYNWIGTLEECDEVVITISWDAKTKEIIDSWSVERAGKKVGETLAVNCD